MGKGHYYKNHNIKNQKEHQKICEPSTSKVSIKEITSSKITSSNQSKTTYGVFPL
jgi:hypothetical protein